MGWKLLVTDLDNTLLRSDKTISDHMLAVFDACRRQGMLTGFATARSEMVCKRFREQVRPDLVISNGALAKLGEQVLYRAAMLPETANEVISYCKSLPSFQYITAETDEGYYVSYEQPPDWPGQADYNFSVYSDFSRPFACDVYKIVVRLGSEADEQQLPGAFPGLRVHHSHGRSAGLRR